MSEMKSARLQNHFIKLTDPRRRKVTYPLINIVVIAVCAVICGADDFVAIAEYGRKKRDWFARFLDLKSGIPSHDRFNAILAAIKPAEFEKCLLSWITALQDITDGQVVAIDGKTLRRSFDAASGKSAIHMVSAWATANQISLGQVVVDQKSNEITAIPKLLKMLEISGCLVTIDAMGCQTEIARKIVEAKADYVLDVKGNQPTLREGIETHFDEHLEDDFARTEIAPLSDGGKRTWADRGTLLLHLSGSRKSAGSRPLVQTAGDRNGRQHHAARRKGVQRNSLLHFEQIPVGSSFCRGGARPLGDREPLALATRRDLPRRSMPHPQGARRHEFQHPPSDRAQHAEKRDQPQSRRQEQTPDRRLG